MNLKTSLVSKAAIAACSILLLVLLVILYLERYTGPEIVNGIPVPAGMEVVHQENRERPRFTRSLLRVKGDVREEPARQFYWQWFDERGWQVEEHDNALVVKKTGKQVRLNFHPQGNRLLLVCNIVEDKKRERQ